MDSGYSSNEQLYINRNHTVSSCYVRIIVDSGFKDDIFEKVVKVWIKDKLNVPEKVIDHKLFN